MNLSEMSLAELRDLDAAISAEIAGGDARRRAAAVEQIYAVAHALGMPLESLLTASARERRKPRRPMQRYQDPADPKNVWGGAGPRPAWLKSALAAGVPIDTLKSSSA